MTIETKITGVSDGIAKAADEEVSTPKNTLPFQGKRIAISVSSHPELSVLGLSEQHIKDITVELSRYLIVNGATLLYGGDLRIGGYTELFADISSQYTNISDRSIRFINYFSFPFAKNLTTIDLARFKAKGVEAKILERPKITEKMGGPESFDPTLVIEDRFVVAESLSDMRLKMADDSDARIIVGGPLRNFMGYYPGVIEEALYSMDRGKPVYVVGGFGGAAKTVASLMAGGDSEELTDEAQFNTEFLKAFKLHSDGLDGIKVDYQKLRESFQKIDLEENLDRLGLSKDEVNVLSTSQNVHEIVFLIIKGLQKSFSGK